ARVDALLARGADHLERIVDAGDGRAPLDDLQCQRPIAATDVEDVLAQLRVEEVERRAAELGDEGADLRIVGRVPLAGRERPLRRRFDFAQWLLRMSGWLQRVLTHSR